MRADDSFYYEMLKRALQTPPDLRPHWITKFANTQQAQQSGSSDLGATLKEKGRELWEWVKGPETNITGGFEKFIKEPGKYLKESIKHQFFHEEGTPEWYNLSRHRLGTKFWNLRLLNAPITAHMLYRDITSPGGPFERIGRVAANLGSMVLMHPKLWGSHGGLPLLIQWPSQMLLSRVGGGLGRRIDKLFGMSPKPKNEFRVPQRFGSQNPGANQ